MCADEKSETGKKRESCTCSWEQTGRSGQVMWRRQASSHGPQRSKSPSSRKTGQEVTAEVQLVRVSLHLLKERTRAVNLAFKRVTPLLCQSLLSAVNMISIKTPTFTFLWWCKIIQATYTCIAHHFPGFCVAEKSQEIGYHVTPWILNVQH